MENTRIEKRCVTCLEVDTRKVGSSVVVMDKFRGLRAENVYYESLVLNHALHLIISNQLYSVSFYVNRSMDKYKKKGSISFTFTELRDLSKKLFEVKGYELYKESAYLESKFRPILNTIKKSARQGSIVTDRKIAFRKPILFQAQSSMNLIGYGDIWQNGYCISEGTKYGETDEYYITHLMLR